MRLFGNSNPFSSSSLSWDLKGIPFIPNPSPDSSVISWSKSPMFDGREGVVINIPANTLPKYDGTPPPVSPNPSSGSMNTSANSPVSPNPSSGPLNTSANSPAKPGSIFPPKGKYGRVWKVVVINNPIPNHDDTRNASKKNLSKFWFIGNFMSVRPRTLYLLRMNQLGLPEFTVKLKEDYVKELSDRTNLAITEAAESCCREFMKDMTRNRPGSGNALYLMDREDYLKFDCCLSEEEFNSIAGRRDVCCVDKVEPSWLPSEKGKDVVDGDAVREAELRFSKSLIKGGRFLPISEMARLRGYPPPKQNPSLINTTSSSTSTSTDLNKQNQAEAVAQEGIL